MASRTRSDDRRDPLLRLRQPVLIVTTDTDTGTRSLEVTPDPTGTVEVRRSGLGWRGRFVGKNTAPAPGWVKYGTHSCKEENL